MFSPSERELLFVPLGGTEEIGMNFNLYGLGAKECHEWIIVDMGITFGNDTTPGVDVIVPDPAFIEERRDHLLGIVLTHGHEDHLGAVPYLWDRLRCPIYATPFTAALLRKKIVDNGETFQSEIIEVPLKGKFDIGPFSIELITLTHSMPEPNGITIRTEFGTIFHTGDWKFDPQPIIGKTSDEVALAALGDEGVLACIGDSTNVFVEGRSASESSLNQNMIDLIGDCTGRVAITCFASNVARLKTIFEAATVNGRAVALVGRSLWRIDAAARETGYLSDLPPFLETPEVQNLAKSEVLYICTGSQGEPRAALNRIASGSHREVVLESGDTVIFSSRIIPGNELAIARLHNRLVSKGVNVISEENDSVHVSGHPARDELIKMYQLIRPQIAIPVHGEQRHLRKHIALAEECQVPETILVKNGSIVRLAPEYGVKAEEVKVGRFSLEGKRLYPLEGNIIQDRTRITYNGTIVATFVFDQKGNIIGEPQFTSYALVDEDEGPYLYEFLIDEVDSAIRELMPEALADDNAVSECVRVVIRRSFRQTHGKKPLVAVHVVRI